MSALKERIEELQTAMGWDDSQTARAAGVSRSAASQWLGKGSKIIHSIGDLEAALNLEQASGYCALWIAKGKGPKRTEHRDGDWPFPHVSPQKVRAMGPTQLAQLETVILLGAAQLGLDVKK